MNVKYTVSQNCATLTMAITLSVLDGLQNSFAAAKTDKFPTRCDGQTNMDFVGNFLSLQQ